MKHPVWTVNELYAAGNINFTVFNNGGCKRLKWVIITSVLILINSSYTIHYCITMNQLVEALCVLFQWAVCRTYSGEWTQLLWIRIRWWVSYEWAYEYFIQHLGHIAPTTSTSAHSSCTCCWQVSVLLVLSEMPLLHRCRHT